MLPAWVLGFADGSEHGSYLALDLGGTNLRVCLVVLEEKGRKYDMFQSKYRLVRLTMVIALMVARRVATWYWRRVVRLCCSLSFQVFKRQFRPYQRQTS